MIDACDRGLAYGDGLFETMRAHCGGLPWWPRHRARLEGGAERLRLRLPPEPVLEAALADALRTCPNGIVKLVLSRGVGGNGYTPDPACAPTLMVTTRPLPPIEKRPLHVDVLRLRLALQPALAGLKHLNRLEQVLGSIEVADRGLDDGLMLDSSGRLVGSTRANLFVLVDGVWRTPPLRDCGIAGTARAVLRSAWPQSRETTLRATDLARAEAMFLTNAVRGILAVGRSGERSVDAGHAGIAEARAVLAASHPGLALS